MKKKNSKNSRVNRAKYAVSQGKKAYKRGKESKLTRGRKLLVGRSGSGFAGRATLLATAAGGIGLYKMGGNLVRSSKNIEQGTRAFRDAARNTSNSTSIINQKIEDAANFVPNLKQNTKQWFKKKATEGVQKRKERLGFSLNNNLINFMEMTSLSIEELQAALDATLAQIDDDLAQGLLTEEEAAQLEQDALEEFDAMEEELAAEEGVDEEGDYSVYNGVLANFSAGTDLGGAVMEYIVAADPEDPEATIADLAWNLGLVDEEGYELDEEEAIAGLIGIMSGEVAPDESLIEGIADYFELEDDEVEEMYELAEAELVDGEYGDEYDDEYDPEYEEGYDDPNTAVLEDEIEQLEGELDEVGGLAEEAFSRVADMEANFALAQEQQDIAREFESLEREAYALVESGQMPPAIFDEHYGNFESREDQLAAFSQVCDSRHVDPETELYRLDGLNETYSGMEPNINFSQMSYSEPNTADYEQDDALIAQAARNVRSRLANNNFGQPLDFSGVAGVSQRHSVVANSLIPAQQQGSINPNMTPLVANGAGVGAGTFGRSF
jgi:hypothetical protein